MSIETNPSPAVAPGAATERELTMRVMPMPADANANGDIFGGWIMAQVDLAGSVLPIRISRGRVATVAVNEFIFKQPVSVGDLHVDVIAERDAANPYVVKVTEANLTYVAIDMEGKPRPFNQVS
jgi:acyl-CoA thioesterase YciA